MTRATENQSFEKRQTDARMEDELWSSSDNDSAEPRDDIIDQECGVEVPNGHNKSTRSSSSFRSIQILQSVSKRKAAAGGSCCCLVLVATGVLLAVLFVVVLEGDPTRIPVSWDEIFDQDPFSAQSPEESIRWGNLGNGLDIQVVNTLDNHWHSYFEQSMFDWDNGYPDALTLSNSSRAPEFNCTHESGIIKVCNGNYGRQPWKGRAEILSNGFSDTIIAATAHLNDFYLSSRNTNEMQYAICHELGHTFGVHHTDENFRNRDLGNCMDYTKRHKNNLKPDASNYKFLHALYGLVPGAVAYNPPTAAPVASTGPPSPTDQFKQDSVPSNTGSGGEDGSEGNGSNGGFTRPPIFPSDTNNAANEETEEETDEEEQKDDRMLNEIPNWLQEAIQEARQRELIGEKKSIELPGGYVLHIHQLKA